MNKKLIKNGMTFITTNGETYLRCGKRVILLDITSAKIKSFESIKEEDIIEWAKYNRLTFINCACKLTSRKDNEGKRKEIKKLIEDLKTINDNVDINILRSSENVNINSIIGYKTNKEKINFLDKY